MRAVLFLSRVAFILNIFFVISLLGRMRLFTINNDYVTGFIITSGFGLALIVNVILNTILAVRVLRGKSNVGIPGWLINTNFILLVAQIIFFFIS
jgi:hypothetical protein